MFALVPGGPAGKEENAFCETSAWLVGISDPGGHTEACILIPAQLPSSSCHGLLQACLHTDMKIRHPHKTPPLSHSALNLDSTLLVTLEVLFRITCHSPPKSAVTGGREETVLYSHPAPGSVPPPPPTFPCGPLRGSLPSPAGTLAQWEGQGSRQPGHSAVGTAPRQLEQAPHAHQMQICPEVGGKPDNTLAVN